MAQNPPKLLAKAETPIFQCVVIDQHFQKRNIAVYICGSDAFWAPNREGLYDPDRARRCPQWLIDQVLSPPAEADIYNFHGEKVLPTVAGEGVKLEPAPTGPTKLKPADALGGEDSISQG